MAPQRIDWQSAALERIAMAAPLSETLDVLTRLVEEQVPGATASVLLLDPGTQRLHAAAGHGLAKAYVDAIDDLAIGPSVGSCGTAAYLGRAVVVTDISTDPLWANFKSLAAEHGLRACWSTPIRSRRRPGAPVVLGTFALYFGEPRAPDDSSFDVLAKAESIACIAIEAARAAAELRESETRFRTYVDHATDALFVHEQPQGTIVDVNAQACASLGYTREELLGALPALFDREPVATSLEVGERQAADEELAFESRHTRKDGSSFPVEVRIRSYVAGDKRFSIAIVRDMTARLELEDRLRQSQKMEAIGRLAGGVAHDFNNLLTVINSQAELMLEDLPPGDPFAQELELVRAAGSRGAALTSQLLAFARRAIVAPRPVKLAALVERLVSMWRRLIGENITLVITADSPEATVHADAGLMEQLLMNLVVNARDAMPDGGTLTVATSALDVLAFGDVQGPKPLVSLKVSDTGHGMTDDVRTRMFEPFFTTKPKGEGSGLGLATVYAIATQAGGQIAVESALGRGTTIEVRLPRVAEAPARGTAPPKAEPRGAGVILLAEDEDDVRRVVERGLAHYGYTVLAARDAEDALRVEAAHAGTIDLLLTDLVMPRTSGRELAAQLRARRPSLRVLYMSGYTDDEVVRRGVTEGADALLQKPFTSRELAERVRAALS